MNELALFAGAGGGILGGKLLGWRTVCAVEWDAYAASVLVARQNERARTHKTRHGRHEVFSCYKSKSASTTRGTKNAISAELHPTIYGSSGASLRMFARIISVMCA